MNYRDILKDIRLAFPQPVADPIHNSYFVHSIMRALDQVDELKTHLPMLGSVIPADFEAAQQPPCPRRCPRLRMSPPTSWAISEV